MPTLLRHPDASPQLEDPKSKLHQRLRLKWFSSQSRRNALFDVLFDPFKLFFADLAPGITFPGNIQSIVSSCSLCHRKATTRPIATRTIGKRAQDQANDTPFHPSWSRIPLRLQREKKEAGAFAPCPGVTYCFWLSLTPAGSFADCIIAAHWSIIFIIRIISSLCSPSFPPFIISSIMDE